MKSPNCYGVVRTTVTPRSSKALLTAGMASTLLIALLRRSTIADGVFFGASDAHPAFGRDRDAALLQGRKIWRVERARRRKDGQGLQLAALHQRHGHRHRLEGQLDLAGEEIRRGRGAALVGNVQEVGAGLAREEFANQVVRRAHAERGIGELPGVGACQRDQLLDRVRLHRGMRDQHEGDGADLGDRLELLQRVVGRLGPDGGEHDQLGARAEKERVAVGRRASHRCGADGAAGAGAIVDHDRLAQLDRKLLGDEARGGVGATARGEGGNQGDGLGGIGRLGMGRRCHRKCRQKYSDDPH